MNSPGWMRATDADRQQTREIVNAAFSDGRLSMDELLERTTAIWESKTFDDLERITADLDHVESKSVVPKPRRFLVRPGPRFKRWLLAGLAVLVATAVVVAGGVTDWFRETAPDPPAVVPAPAPAPAPVEPEEAPAGPVENPGGEVANRRIAYCYSSDFYGELVFCGSRADQFFDVAVATNGNVLASGTTESSVFGKVTGLLTVTNSYDLIALNGDGWPYLALANGKDDSVIAVGHKSGQAAVTQLTSTGGFVWEKTVNKGYFTDVAVAKDGSIYALGRAITKAGGYHAMMAKLSPQGKVVWVKDYGNSLKTFGGILTRVAVTAKGEIFAIGSHTSSSVTSPEDGGTAVIAKFSKDGQILWSKEYGEYAFADAVGLKNGHLLVVGESSSTYRRSALLAEIGTNGKIVWTKTIGGSFSYGLRAVAVAPSGEIAAVGYSQSVGTDFRNPDGGQPEAFIVVYSATGELLWSKVYTLNGSDIFNGVAFGKSGEIIAVGFRSDTSYSPPADEGDPDAFMVRLTLAGDPAG